MNKLWDYRDYVEHLSHKNGLIKRWALRGLENRYWNAYADEVSLLMGDDDEYIVCNAIRYLARHQAIQYAPAILEVFKNNTNIIAGNSAAALGRMHYEPAMNTILEHFYKPDDSESFLGMLNYLSYLQTDQTRVALRTAISDLDEDILYRPAIQSLLYHCHTEDIVFVMDKIFNSAENIEPDALTLRDIVIAFDGHIYFTELTYRGEDNIWSKPTRSIGSFLSNNSNIKLNSSFRENIISALEKRQYENLATMLMFDARNVIENRYAGKPISDTLKNLHDQDAMCLSMLEDLSKRTTAWKRLSKEDMPELIPFALSTYFTIMERDPYAKTFYTEEITAEKLIQTLQKSGPALPLEIQNMIKEVVPADDLKRVLSNSLDSWCDIWAVRTMGQTGNIEFVPDLLRVIRDADSLEIIYSDAKTAISCMDESIDRTLFEAAKSDELGDWESFSLLERLPYSESYDLAIQLWEADDCEMDSYEIFAMCLREIGDKRGIDTLLDVYHNRNNAGYIGKAIELLGELHNSDVPEIEEIRENHKEQYELQVARRKEFDDIAHQYYEKKKQKDLVNNVVQFKRDKPKVGRNEPCPCGSGKKYKTCCLNKE